MYFQQLESDIATISKSAKGRVLFFDADGVCVLGLSETSQIQMQYSGGYIYVIQDGGGTSVPNQSGASNTPMGFNSSFYKFTVIGLTDIDGKPYTALTQPDYDMNTYLTKVRDAYEYLVGNIFVGCCNTSTDSILWYADEASFPATGIVETLYVDMATPALFLWDGAAYVQIGGGGGSFVPYTGATGDVDLGTHGITSDFFQADLTPTNALQVGRMRWNDTDGTMDLRLKGNNVTLQIGQEQVARVVNKTTPLIDLLEANYQVVLVTGATGQRLSVRLAQGNNDANSAGTLGIVTETILGNQEGFITVLGQVKEINTTGSLQGETWVDGQVLYLSPTTAGAITNVKPTAPQHSVIVGYVEYAHAIHGKIFVKVDNGYELDELHNVLISSPSTGQTLLYDSVVGVWSNEDVPNVNLSLISVTSTNAREDNWSPTGWSASTIKVIDFTPNNTNNIISIGGLANPSAGKIVTIVNSSTNNLVIIENEATTSTAANRFKLAQKSPYFLMPEREITFLYTGTRWAQFNTHPNQGGFDFYDDFENLNPTAGSQATKMFYGVVGAGSTGAGLLSSGDTSTAWGVMLLTAGTTATGFLYASVDYRRTGASSIFGVNGLCPQLWVTKTKIVTLPTAAQDFNFNAGLNCASSLVSGGQFGLMWEMPTFASGGVTPAFWNIRITNSVGALTILTTTSVPITANTYIYLGIFSTSTNGDAIFFYSTDGITYSFAYRFTRVTGNYGGLPFYRLAGTVGTSNFRTASVDWCGESFNLIR
jgi:hypothetical protein